jgi:thiol-disulfide isomerase/thioredoxin
VASSYIRSFVVGTLAVLAISAASRAAHAGTPNFTPEAKKLFDDVAQAYKGLSSYADEGQFKASVKVDGKPQNEMLPVKVAYAKPNKIMIDAGEVRLVGDGKSLTSIAVAAKKYFDIPAPAVLTPEVVGEGPIGSILFGGPMGQPAFVLLGLLLGDQPTKAIPPRASGVRLEADRSWNGRSYRSLLVDQGDDPGLRMYVDPASKLIHRIELVIDPKVLAARSPDNVKLSDMSLEWLSGSIATSAPKAGTFAFSPPAGFTKITAPEAAAVPGGERNFLVNALVGKAAPEFSFVAFDGPGKTKKVQKADLAGKVVLIDFWATWCGPCLAELPDIQEVINKFQKDKKNVLFLIVSQDAEPADDLPGIRKLVEKTLDENKLKLAGKANTILGLDSSQAMGELFRVEGIPTVVILGPDGTVQAAHVGAGYPVVETLTKELETLLQGKPLAPIEAKAPAKL